MANTNKITALLTMAKKTFNELDPVVKETMLSLAKDPNTTLSPDELIIASHQLMGTPMSSELKTIVSELKRTRQPALDLEAATAMPAAPALVPGQPGFPALPPLQGHSLESALMAGNLANRQLLNALEESKKQSILDYKTARKFNKELARRVGKRVKQTDTSIKGIKNEIQKHTDREIYYKLKEEFGI